MTLNEYTVIPPCTPFFVPQGPNGGVRDTVPELMQEQPPLATLALKNGTCLQGYSFGAEGKDISGECVFQTGMVGYPESLTDPSYSGQILVITYPLVGNYGVPDRTVLDPLLKDIPAYFESHKIHIAALVVSQASPEFSHYLASSSLSDWLKEQGIPAIYGVDTRAITKKIREEGVMLGKVVFPKNNAKVATASDIEAIQWCDPNETNLVAEVSIKEPKLYKPDPNMVRTLPNGKPVRVVAVDIGMKFNQTRCLVKRGIEVLVVPWDYDFNKEENIDGLFLSNGPGDPATITPTIENIKKALASKRFPIFGICLGHQVLAIASGAKTEKMKYGNRGQNIPCTHHLTGRCYITTQNHGYAVETSTLPSNVRELFINANDNTNEGIYMSDLPHFSVQFHPEAAAGPCDTEYLFDIFIDTIIRCAETGKVEGPVEFPGTKEAEERAKREAEWNAEPVEDDSFVGRIVNGRRIRKVLVLGSGGLTIGQAGEFDYSGSQAIKALKEENIYTVLINPNIATIQTSKGLADKCYFLPVTPDCVRKVILREKPDGIYCTFGGQTALNIGVKLKDEFEGLGVQVLGTPIETIMVTEDRELFASAVAEINEKCAKSHSATNIQDAVEAANEIGYPLIIRAAYALGGLGSGFASNEEELVQLCKKAFAASPQVLVERSMKGWKEIEYEVVRDSYNNCITVCNMENFDPLGIHTGDSIVVAPSQTLSNDDYQMLRNTAVNVIRHLGVVGECNIQYALNPDSKEYCIIEVNARLSRSSALASKATGYPLAFVAAKLGLGIPLNKIRNTVTKKTISCFEPSLDYIVAKIPRWDLKKFNRVSKNLSSAMKSVGEVMAIGRTFEETIQEAIRSVDTSFDGFGRNTYVNETKEEIEQELTSPTDLRMFAIANAFHMGYTAEKIWELTKIDKWFLCKLRGLVEMEKQLNTIDTAQEIPQTYIKRAKMLGFSDRAIATFTGRNELQVRNRRLECGITPFVKQIDTVAAEFPAYTNYLYMTYNASENDVAFEDHGVMVMGSGVYRIGSSVEFDWCAVRAIRTLRENGFKTVMINYNPETVSTDYDEADRLYFTNITLERVMDIYEIEKSAGVILSMGGQAPNNIALALHRQKVKIFGTSPDNIDNAENRYKFSRMLDQINVDQPRWKELTDMSEAESFCDEVGYPVLVRPSYVLSGAAMNVVFSKDDLSSYLHQAVTVSREHPVVITKYIEEAKEIDVDAVALDGKLIMHCVSEHVENAGVHSGDATLVQPPQDLDPVTVKKIEEATAKIGKALDVTGPYNIQFMAKNNEIKVIECNVRAARSFPFVSKVTGVDLIEMATKAMLGLPVVPYPNAGKRLSYVGVKVPQFSFSRLLGADPLLGVEMASTGEVAAFGRDKYDAYLKALVATGFRVPEKNILFSIGSFKEKQELLPSIKLLHQMGFKIFATSGTADFIQEHNIPVKTLDAESQIEEYSLQQYLANNLIDMYINLPSKNRYRRPSSYVSAGYKSRRMAIDYSVPLITNIKCAKIFIEAIARYNPKKWEIANLDYISSHRTVVLPGLVNIGSLFANVNNSQKFLNATKSAVCAGFTEIVVSPNTVDFSATDDHTLVMLKSVTNGNSFVDYKIGTVASEDNASKIQDLSNEGPVLFISFNKRLSTYIDKYDTVGKQIKEWPETSPIITDASGNDLASVLLMAWIHNRSIHVTDIHSIEDLDLIRQSRDKGLPVTCDISVFTLFVTKEKTGGSALDGGRQLLTEREAEAMWDNLEEIDCFSIGTLPNALSNNADGAVGYALALPLLLTAVAQKRLTVDDVVLRFSTNPRRIFNLGEQSDTYVEVHLDRNQKITERHPDSKWFPSKAVESLSGFVHRVVLRNKTLFLDNKFYGSDDGPTGREQSANYRTLSSGPSRKEVLTGVGIDGLSPFVHTQYERAAASSRLAPRRISLSSSIAEDTFIAATAPPSTVITAPETAASANKVDEPIAKRYGVKQGATPLNLNMVENSLSDVFARHGGPNPFYMKHILSVRQFNRKDLHLLFAIAQEIRIQVERHGRIPLLKGRHMAAVFYEPSSRTLASFQAAMMRLGGQVVTANSDNSSIAKGESAEDTVRAFGSYSECIVLRHPEAGMVERVAKNSNVPVINAGDGTGEHPTQAMLDAFTIREELGTINGLTITMIGDLHNGRTVHSLASVLAEHKVKLNFVAPAGLGMPDYIKESIMQRGPHVVINEYTELNDEILDNTDVLYVTRVQKERFTDPAEYEKVKDSFVIDNNTMRKCKPNMIVMHPLPRINEISSNVDTDPRAAYFRQMRYGMFVRMALLMLVMNHTL
ncbi:Carbamoyl-phosphate synthase [Mycoemilia scoparia]|uniref:Ammonium-dependent carbamoyl phosphate synthetase n=1 Tax=Mycoemilia scoparia TaxID=417184 RepID=A0A9W7ZYJ6_9FUNG|nr:Carbamoyl-phosphate synthase [Mycoemilia scoparia]